MFESECASKDDVIEQLHEEVTNLQTFIRQVEVGCCSECHNLIGNGNAKLMQLAEDMDCKQVTSYNALAELCTSILCHGIVVFLRFVRWLSVIRTPY